MNAIVLFCLIGAAVATRQEFGGVYEEKYPVLGKEEVELRSEFLPEVRREIEYPVYQYGRHSMHYPQHSRMSYEYPIYGEHHYPEIYRTSQHRYHEERPIYEKSYYPEMYKESTHMSYPYYKNYEYPLYHKYEYPVHHEYPMYQKYEYPVYKHEEYQTPVYTKGYPWVQHQYQREYPIYKSYPIDQYLY